MEKLRQMDQRTKIFMTMNKDLLPANEKCEVHTISLQTFFV